MNKLLKTYNFTNFQIHKGKGSYLYSKNNQKFLDFSAGVAVNSLGYDHPTIINALKAQIKTGITHLAGSQLHEFKIKLSAKLSKNTNNGDVFFSNSGAESIEAAIKIIRNIGAAQKRDEIIAMSSSFHGRTIGALSLGSNKKYKSSIGPVPGKVKFCKFNDSKLLKKLISKKTIAIILEVTQGDGGVNVCTQEFAKSIKEVCKKNNIYLIVDEIQAGMGRSGKLFAYQHYNLKPDIITVAKGLGGGIPIGATIVNKNLSNKIEVGFHGSTFGGGMLQTRVSYEVLNTINKPKFLQKVLKKSNLLMKLLGNIEKKHSKTIKEIRGLGLLIGLEFHNPNIAKLVFNQLMKNNLITTLVQGNTIRISPPLIISEKEIRNGIRILEKVLNKI